MQGRQGYDDGGVWGGVNFQDSWSKASQVARGLVKVTSENFVFP